MSYAEYSKINCNCNLFEPEETQKQLDELLDAANTLLDNLKKNKNGEV